MVERQGPHAEGMNPAINRLFRSPRENETFDEEFQSTYSANFGGGEAAGLKHYQFLESRLPKDCELKGRGNRNFAQTLFNQDPQNCTMVQDGDEWVIYCKIPPHTPQNVRE